MTYHCYIFIFRLENSQLFCDNTLFYFVLLFSIALQLIFKNLPQLCLNFDREHSRLRANQIFHDFLFRKTIRKVCNFFDFVCGFFQVD